MNTDAMQAQAAHRLLELGVLLFLLGLLTGFFIPMLASPRMGLSSHLEGVMNGTFLIVLGLLWPKLRLSRGGLSVAFWLAVFGTFANWLATLLAAAWGAGVTMMPIAGAGLQGTASQEIVIAVLLWTLSLAMVVVCAMVLWGLRGAVGASRGSPA